MTGHRDAQVDLRERIHGFVVAAETNELTEEHWARFERLLLESDDACRLYAEYMDVSLSLASILDAMPCPYDAPSDLPVPEPSESATPQFSRFPSLVLNGSAGYLTDWPIAYLVATVILAVGLAIAAFTYVSQPGPVAHKTLPSPSGGRHEVLAAGGEGRKSLDSPLPSVVARITGMVDCVWEKKGTDPVCPVGPEGAEHKRGLSPFSPEGAVARGQGAGTANQKSVITNHQSLLRLGDTLALRSGLLELTYDTGAKVILQGPVTYEIESPSGGFLSIGKLTALLDRHSEISNLKSQIPNQTSEIRNHQFSVRTPTALVTDLGTEFGVDVGRNGITSTHVFLGSVRLQPMTRDGQFEQSICLKQNESARVEVPGDCDMPKIVRGDVHRAVYVRSSQFSKLADDSKWTLSRRWRAYSGQLRRDRDLVAYYDFQRHAESSNVLHAAADGVSNELDGKIEGATWTAAPVAGKQALYFDGDQANVKFNIPRKMTKMTLATWIAVDFIDDNSISCVLLTSYWPQPNTAENCTWQICRSGEVVFHTTNRTDGKTIPLLPWNKWGHNQWHHLAVVVDPDIRKMTHYLDGVKVHVGEVAQTLAVSISRAQVGNWWPFSNNERRAFRGSMSELTILSRAASDQEITAMYEAGKP